MAIRKVVVKGLPELEKKLDAEFLYHPAMEEVVEKFGTRIERIPGKARSNAGVAQNRVTISNKGLGATVTTSLRGNSRSESNPNSPRFNPRSTGRSWQDENTKIVKGMSSATINAAAKRIEEAWGS